MYKFLLYIDTITTKIFQVGSWMSIVLLGLALFDLWLNIKAVFERVYLFLVCGASMESTYYVDRKRRGETIKQNGPTFRIIFPSGSVFAFYPIASILVEH